MNLTVAVVGGGPAGLFLARLLKLGNRDASVTVYERNAPTTTFGFGVVFSDRTMAAFAAADPETTDLLQDASVHWTEMELRYRGSALRYGGYGFAAIPRARLLGILQRQAQASGVELRFEHQVPASGPAGFADVIAVADGLNSALRQAHASEFGTSVQTGGARYIWLGTRQRFDRVTFPFVETEYGAFAAHAYPYGGGLSTFIVEADEATLRTAGMDRFDAEASKPGMSDCYSRALLEEIFAEHLGGHELLANNSKWAAFRVIRNRRWHHGNMVLLGDAAHTAHFSVGSGTKLAMEDAVALADELNRAGSITDAFRGYERRRRPEVARTQQWADPSMRWWGSVGRRMAVDPVQFGFHFLTRTGAISYSGLRRRDPGRIDEVERWYAARHGAGSSDEAPPPPAVLTPLRLGEAWLPNRIVGTAQGSHPEEQRGAAELLAGQGCGLVAVRCGDNPAVAAAGALAAPVAGAGSVLLAALSSDRSYDLSVAGCRLPLLGIEFGEQAIRARQPLPVWARLPQPHRQVVVAIFDCPREPSWTPQGERVISWCAELAGTVAGFWLRPPASVSAAESWDSLVEYADSIAERTGRPVIGQLPPDAVRGPDELAEWSDRVQIALLSGRIDAVAGLPLPIRRGAAVPLGAGMAPSALA
jgi:anthraniloyl-CoA monooxygenase